MSKDTRKPVEVTHKGAFSVRIFDMEAYERNIQQYYQEEQSNVTPAKQKPKKPYIPFPNRSYGWYKGMNVNQEKKGA